MNPLFANLPNVIKQLIVTFIPPTPTACIIRNFFKELPNNDFYEIEESTSAFITMRFNPRIYNNKSLCNYNYYVIRELDIAECEWNKNIYARKEDWHRYIGKHYEIKELQVFNINYVGSYIKHLQLTE